jgi:hypothetical protein
VGKFGVGSIGDLGARQFQLIGKATQYFSDRMIGSQTFDINRTDFVSVEIPPIGLLKLISSWGNAVIPSIDCTNGCC